MFLVRMPEEQSDAKEKLSLVLTADPGDLIGGYGESSVLFSVATDIQQVKDQDALLCAAAHRVKLFGADALLITTGIGTSRAALCLDTVLRAYGSRAKEIIYLGTAGGSPAIGGLIDSDSCDSELPASSDRVVRLGDVCVSSRTTDWDCQRCVFPENVSSSACQVTECTLHNRWDLFGDFACSYYQDIALAQEIKRAAADVKVSPSSGLTELEDAFWKMSTGLSDQWREAHDAAATETRPRIFGDDECAEATSMTYWNGAPYDQLARTYVADLINQASNNASEENLITRRDVVAVSAMEAAGWMLVLRLSEVYLDYAEIPAANIRAISDYDQDPLVFQNKLWLEDRDWLATTQLRHNATRLGYEFAIQTSSQVVIKLFQSRAAAAAADIRSLSPS